MAVTLDLMEYANDGAAQTAYVSSDADIGLDSNTKLLMHMDGADNGTTFGDSSTENNKGNASVTATVQTKTAVKKWGTASALFDGDSGFLSYATSADWNIFGSNSDDWTVDFQFKFVDFTGTQFVLNQKIDASHFWIIQHDNSAGRGWKLQVNDGSLIIDTGWANYTRDTNWHHFALCKVADKYGIYIDGVQFTYVQDSSTYTLAVPFIIGKRPINNDLFYDGYMDELSIQNSNIFGAAPNVGLSNTITVPTEAYPYDNLQSYSESTIKQQGSYSLKGVAIQTDSLNDTLTRTI